MLVMLVKIYFFYFFRKDTERMERTFLVDILGGSEVIIHRITVQKY